MRKCLSCDNIIKKGNRKYCLECLSQFEIEKDKNKKDRLRKKINDLKVYKRKVKRQAISEYVKKQKHKK